MKNKNIIDEKIKMIEKSIIDCNDDIFLKRLTETLQMLNDKKNGLIPSKPKYSDFDKKEKKYRVYHLLSKSGDIIYVGITTNTLRKRLSGGYTWLDIEEYDMELIEETEDPTRERYWIEKYTEQGYKLYNSHIPSDIERGYIKANSRKEYQKEYDKKYREYVKNK
jgi:hypothetical protein